jgi:hypothetical protein
MLRRTMGWICGIFFFSWFAFASEAPAQSVLVVSGGGGGNFTSITAAVAAAADGDTILVKSGAYAAPTIDGKSLVLVSEAGSNVSLTGTTVIKNVVAAKSVAVRGFAGASASGPGLRVTNCLGPVTIERSSFNGANAASLFPGVVLEAYAGGLIESCDSVAFSKTALTGGNGLDLDDKDFYSWAPSGGAGLKSVASRTSSTWCVLTGGNGADVLDTTTKPGGDGGAGANVNGGFLFAAGCEFHGGHGGHGDCNPPFGGCGNGGAGGSGILLSGAPVARLLDCEYFPGLGGLGGSGNPANPGVPILGAGDVATLPGEARVYGASSPVREGGTLVLSFVGAPAEIVGVLYAWQPQPLLYVESWSGTVIPNLAVADAIAAGTVAADGTLVTAIPMGALPPTILGLTFHTQSFFVAPDFSAVVLGPFATVT